jgi:hypothetical protein
MRLASFSLGVFFSPLPTRSQAGAHGFCGLPSGTLSCRRRSEASARETVRPGANWPGGRLPRAVGEAGHQRYERPGLAEAQVTASAVCTQLAALLDGFVEVHADAGDPSGNLQVIVRYFSLTQCHRWLGAVGAKGPDRKPASRLRADSRKHLLGGMRLPRYLLVVLFLAGRRFRVLVR